ncbi:hypothetical protein D8674_042830 [Pyrus ussuriensis x Pyrus communis]|uniref:F-box domain-containing protein n=1 Tax=Pyrus ussuriensis x Pyrus communis TaxID=2448454 RepID=A0A5N5FNW2_9ROSA|nr:hypothetical protein D8674_042830 [Pyrus ussuriensis x Pyrus communis]
MLQPEPHLPVTPIIADNLSLDPFCSQRRRHQAVGRPIPAAMGSSASESDEQLSSKFLINDLPDGVLVEILCRLPYKYARLNKRVCKRWLALISDSYFAARFLCMQIDKNKPIALLRTLLFSTPTAKPSPAGFTYRLAVSDALLWKTSIIALHFIPPFEDVKEKLVVAMYNDLVLCCLTKDDPHKYYICNPNSMQCLALPPAPPRHKIAQVGFICQSYYASQEQVSGGGTSTSITINDEYRCRVVRIIQLGDNLSQFKVDIFLQKLVNGENQLYHVHNKVLVLVSLSTVQALLTTACCIGRVTVALSGLIRLHPTAVTMGVASLSLMSLWTIQQRFACLGVCRARLRMFQLQTWMPPETVRNPYHDGRPLIVCVSELKEDEAAGGGRVKWCLIHKASLDEMDVGKYDFINDCIRLRYKIRVLAVDPNAGDILYLEMGGYIIKCNIQARTLEKSENQMHARTTRDFWPWKDVWTYVIPCWPTPLPRVGLPPLSEKKKGSKNRLP